MKTTTIWDPTNVYLIPITEEIRVRRKIANHMQRMQRAVNEGNAYVAGDRLRKIGNILNDQL